MRRRVLRLAMALAALLALLALAAGLAIGWLLGSAGGRDVALARAIAALPEGALRIGAREGSVAGGLRLHDVVYDADGLRIEIDRLSATPRWPGFAPPALNLAVLRADGVRVLRHDAADEPSPPWPEGLPTLDVPLALRVDALDLREVVVQFAGEPGAAPPAPRRMARIAAAVSLSRGRLAVDALEVEAPQGRLEGRIAYAPADHYAAALALRADVAAGARMALDLEGDLARGRATLSGEAGGPLRIDAGWQDAQTLATLGWQLQAEAEGLRLASLGIEGDPAPVDLALSLRGGVAAEDAPAPDAEVLVDPAAPGLRIAARGRVVQGPWTVELRDSRLRLDTGVVHAEPLALSLLDGRLDLTGRYGLDDGAMAVAARADGLAWGDGEARVRASGEARITGTTADWRSTLALDLARGAQRARLGGEARGDAEAVVLAPFTLTTPGGELAGEGRYALDASAAFALEARLRGLDPGWLLPAWPGALDGALRVVGAAPADGPRVWRAAVDDLRGRLRGQPVAGTGRIEARGEALRADARLAVGEGRIEARGALAPALDLDAALQRVDLAPWLDGARGTLDGRLRLRGDAVRPGLEADLVLLDAGWGDLGLQRLRVVGTLPPRGDGGIDLRAEGLAQGAARVGTLAVRLDGSVEAGRFALQADGLLVPGLPTGADAPPGRLRADGAWEHPRGVRRGRLDVAALDVRLPALPPVALAAPSRVEWALADDVDWRLPAPACIAVGASGRLCAAGDARDLRLDGDGLDLAWARPFLPADTAAPLQPEGVVRLQAARRDGPDGRRSSLRVEAPEGRLRLGGAAPAAVFGWRDLVLEAEQSAGWRVALRGDLDPDGRIEARIAAEADGALSGEIALRATDLALLEALSTDIVAPRGVIDGRLRLAGSVEAPRWQGALAAAPFAVEVPALGIAVVDGDLRVEGGEDGQLRLRGRLPTGDGALELAGQWSEDDRPNRLSIRGTGVRVLDTPDARAWVSPALDVELADGVARVRGRVDVPRAEIALDRFEQGVGASEDVVVVDDPAAESRVPGLRIDADYVIAFGDDVRLRGFGFDGGLDGELRLRDRLDRAPRLRGTLELAGEVRAYGQRLDLERGLLRWGNVAIDEPAIDVRAVRPDSDPEVGVAVSGTASAPQVEVWSRPPLPQAEALSWLMFGRPLAAADGEDAAQLQQAATSLGGSAVAQALAGQVGLDSASVGESRALGGTAVTVGKRITPKLYVSYGMALSGTGQVVTVTYALRRWLAAQFEAGLEQRIELEAKVDRD